jgi:hypothetical protein
MARTKGSKNRMTIAVKDAVQNAFTIKNKDNKYLLGLADEHPAVFCNLVAKCIPQAVALDVTHHALDLGLAMRQAQDRLNPINPAPAKVIDHEPAPVTVEPERVSGKKKSKSVCKKRTGGGTGVPHGGEEQRD